MKRDQGGIALITAILVVALATIAAAGILVSANIAIHRAGNLANSEKAWGYANGIESWVKSILIRDSKDNNTDSLKDKWATDVGVLPVDEGAITGVVVDQQGLFNLNNLGVKDAQLYQKYLEHFERLFQNIEGVDAFAARPLAAAIRDWVDADSQRSGTDGAEDTEYSSLSPPYRAANRPMESVSELLAVKGITPKLYGQLLPFITVLPQLGTALNINTAPEPLLRAAVKTVNADLEGFLRRRADTPATDTQSLQTAFDAGTPPISVKSQFFMLRAETYIGSGRVALYSFYYRPEQGAPVVLGRSTDTP